MKVLKLCIGVLLSFSFLLGHAQTSNALAKDTLAKFEPADGACLVFIGQDLAATGGLDEYTTGYTDFFDTPSGVTIYTNLSPGDESFGYYNKGLDGLTTKANWGAGDAAAQYYIDDATYKNSVLAIGLSMVNHEKKVAKGEHDDLIRELGQLDQVY